MKIERRALTLKEKLTIAKEIIKLVAFFASKYYDHAENKCNIEFNNKMNELIASKYKRFDDQSEADDYCNGIYRDLKDPYRVVSTSDVKLLTEYYTDKYELMKNSPFISNSDKAGMKECINNLQTLTKSLEDNGLNESKYSKRLIMTNAKLYAYCAARMMAYSPLSWLRNKIMNAAQKKANEKIEKLKSGKMSPSEAQKYKELLQREIEMMEDALKKADPNSENINTIKSNAQKVISDDKSYISMCDKIINSAK